MTLPPVDGLLVDLDGTMVDSAPDIAAALDAMLATRGLAPVDLERVARLVGRGARHLVAAVLDERGGPDGLDAREAALADYLRHYEALNGSRSKVFPGVREGLASIAARGYRMACLTNKPTSLAVGLLRATGLEPFFEHVMGGDRFARLKPDPLPLVATCEVMGTVPRRTLMVGDSSNDAAAARAAGCPVVLVTYGYNHGEPIRAVDADGFVDSLEHLALPSRATA